MLLSLSSCLFVRDTHSNVTLVIVVLNFKTVMSPSFLMRLGHHFDFSTSLPSAIDPVVFCLQVFCCKQTRLMYLCGISNASMELFGIPRGINAWTFVLYLSLAFVLF